METKPANQSFANSLTGKGNLDTAKSIVKSIPTPGKAIGLLNDALLTNAYPNEADRPKDIAGAIYREATKKRTTAEKLGIKKNDKK